MGAGKGLFPRDSPAGNPARKVYVYVVFSPLILSFEGKPPLTLRQENHYLVFWPLFPLYAQDFFSVVRHFSLDFPQKKCMHYRILGLHYGLASTTPPLYAKPRAKVKGGCLSCVAISAASYRGAKCPTLKTAEETAEKDAEWVTVKQPKNSRKNSRNTRKTVETSVFRVFRLFIRLFFGCFTVTHSASFSAVSNVGHLAPL